MLAAGMQQAAAQSQTQTILVPPKFSGGTITLPQIIKVQLKPASAAPTATATKPLTLTIPLWPGKGSQQQQAEAPAAAAAAAAPTPEQALTIMRDDPERLFDAVSGGGASGAAGAPKAEIRLRGTEKFSPEALARVTDGAASTYYLLPLPSAAVGGSDGGVLASGGPLKILEVRLPKPASISEATLLIDPAASSPTNYSSCLTTAYWQSEDGARLETMPDRAFTPDMRAARVNYWDRANKGAGGRCGYFAGCMRACVSGRAAGSSGGPMTDMPAGFDLLALSLPPSQAPPHPTFNREFRPNPQAAPAASAAPPSRCTSRRPAPRRGRWRPPSRRCSSSRRPACSRLAARGRSRTTTSTPAASARSAARSPTSGQSSPR